MFQIRNVDILIIRIENHTDDNSERGYSSYIFRNPWYERDG